MTYIITAHLFFHGTTCEQFPFICSAHYSFILTKIHVNDTIWWSELVWLVWRLFLFPRTIITFFIGFFFFLKKVTRSTVDSSTVCDHEHPCSEATKGKTVSPFNPQDTELLSTVELFMVNSDRRLKLMRPCAIRFSLKELRHRQRPGLWSFAVHYHLQATLSHQDGDRNAIRRVSLLSVFYRMRSSLAAW